VYILAKENSEAISINNSFLNQQHFKRNNFAKHLQKLVY